MNREELLKINDKELFEEELIKISKDYESNIKKWDEDLIEHYLKIADISLEQFKNSFDDNFIPEDYE